MTSSGKPLSEFELIKVFFKSKADAMDLSGAPAVTLGIGDDCALLATLAHEELAITSDMLVEGRHFFRDANPEWLGYKALAVNLSDLAAMGAKPQGFTLALALPAPIMPLTDSPEVFGLHSNAAITFQLQEGRKMVETVLSIQPRVAAGGSGSGKAMTEEDIVLEVI